MEKNFEISLDLLKKEELPFSVDVLQRLWINLSCSALPAGLDHMVFDTAIVCGPQVTRRWFNLIVDSLPSKSDRISDSHWLTKLRTVDDDWIRTAIKTLELFRRRRAKLDPEWEINSAKVTNRISRATHRAIKLLEGSPQDEVAA